jgi:hypothetical protein
MPQLPGSIPIARESLTVMGALQNKIRQLKKERVDTAAEQHV